MIALTAIIAKREREARRREAQTRDDHRLDSFFPCTGLEGDEHEWYWGWFRVFRIDPDGTHRSVKRYRKRKRGDNGQADD